MAKHNAMFHGARREGDKNGTMIHGMEAQDIGVREMNPTGKAVDGIKAGMKAATTNPSLMLPLRQRTGVNTKDKIIHPQNANKGILGVDLLEIEKITLKNAIQSEGRGMKPTNRVDLPNFRSSLTALRRRKKGSDLGEPSLFVQHARTSGKNILPPLTRNAGLPRFEATHRRYSIRLHPHQRT